MRRSHRSASARTRTSSICTTTCKPRLPPMETTLALAFCQLLMIGIPMRIEIDVDKDRLWGDLTSLATFTAPDSDEGVTRRADRKSTRLNSSHVAISYAVFCLKKKKKTKR